MTKRRRSKPVPKNVWQFMGEYPVVAITLVVIIGFFFTYKFSCKRKGFNLEKENITIPQIKK